jgi:hypothetical protein
MKATLALAALLATTGACAAEAYTPTRYDLSALPAYKPEQMALGVVRIYGTPLESLVGAWAAGFRDKQAHVRLNAYLVNTSQAFAGLLTDKADIGLMGHRTWHTSLMAFNKAFGYEPLEIRFATGPYDDPEGSTPGADVRRPQEQPARAADAGADRRNLLRATHGCVGRHQVVDRGRARAGEEHPHLGPARVDGRDDSTGCVGREPG